MKYASVLATLAVGLGLGLAPKLYGVLVLKFAFAARTGVDGDWQAIQDRFRIFVFAIQRFFNLDLTPSLLWNSLIAGCILLPLVFFIWRSTRAALKFLDPTQDKESLLGVSLYSTLIVAVCFGFFVSNNSIDINCIRYLAPCVLIGAAAVGTILSSWLSRKTLVALALGLVILCQSGFALYQIAHGVLRPYAQLEILSWLQTRNIHAAVTEYWYGYSITFLSKESIVTEPLHDAYIPYYSAPVAQADTIAYLDKRPNEYSIVLDQTGRQTLTILGIRYAVIESRAFTGPKPTPYDPTSSQIVDGYILKRI